MLLNVVVFKARLIRVKLILRVKNYPLKDRNFVIYFVDKPCRQRPLTPVRNIC